MRTLELPQDRLILWGLLASILLHAVLLAMLTLSPRPLRFETRPESSVDIEIAAPPQAPPSPAAMIRATRLLAAATFADPRSRQAREMLPHLATSERVEQLCGLEAMGQVHAWKDDFQPDTLVAYAMAETRIVSTTVEADGGAFRSRKHWYNIKFRCEVAPDLAKVVSFEFAVGSEIPRHDWQKHNLTVDDGPGD